MSKRWPFTLAYIIVALVGITLKIWGPDYGISEYVGWSLLPLAFTITFYPQRPRQRRWLALGTFFVLAEIGYLLPAFWHEGITTWVSLLFVIIGGLAVLFIPPRMPLWMKKETPQAQA